MIALDSQAWKDFVGHILYWETGYKNPSVSQGLSNDPRDTGAAVCVQPGQYHTNKGVTFCTFKSIGPKVGISPITYDRFLKLTSEDVGKFIYEFYKNIQGNAFSQSIGLSLAEAAWGSGPNRAAKHLQKALNNMGKNLVVDGSIGPKTIAAANSVNQKTLYDLFWADRKAFLKSLSNYSTYGTGWMNRVNSFLASFKPVGLVISVGLLVGIMATAYYFATNDKHVEKVLDKLELPL